MTRKRLKLGKRACFVKTHLKQLPQADEVWEADFPAIPREEERGETPHLGLAVCLPDGDPLEYLPVRYTPNVNDLADLLAKAMSRPLTGEARRPQCIHLRANPHWDELIPHLKQLGIETAIQEELPRVEDARVDFLREMRRGSSGPLIMLSQKPPSVERMFPAIAQWVRDGHIEIGDQEGTGFVVRALDYGGQVFEDEKPRSLGEAMESLEKGLGEWFQEQGIEVEERE